MKHNFWNYLTKKYIYEENSAQTYSGALENILFLWPPILEYLDDIQNKEILDFGCGTGSLCKRFYEMGAHATGVDNSIEMLNLAKQINYENSIEFSNSIKKIQSKKFSAITSIHVFEFIDTIEDTFAQLTKLLDSNGKFCFAVHDPDYLINDSSRYDTDGFQSTYQFDDIKIPIFPRESKFYENLLIANGFKDISVLYPEYTRSFKTKYDIPKSLKNWATVFLATKI